ncbi:MAG: Gfo/Idh/MocA family oxidoreductase [Candidatus Rokubacteria bacterium]|nr:Gfo/Idh/MocA family oxidoreductase [Candidatus Rokubacteria bacterium]
MENEFLSVPFGYTPVWAEKDKYNVKNPPSDDKKPLRLGLVGLGGVALGKHLPAIRRLQETGFPIRVVAGADIDETVRSKTQRLHHLPCYADFREMFDKEGLDAVEVLTEPGESRLRVLREAVDRDLHLFVEKPFLFFGVKRLDESIACARQIVERARAKRLVVMTGFVKHFSPPYMVAKRLMEAGAIGTPALVAVKMCQGWSRHILLEGQACHLLHVALWLAGPIARLHAFGVNRFAEPNYPYDNIVVNVEYASEAIGTFYFNSSSPSLKPWERLEVFGERKWLAVEDGISVTLHDSEEGPSKSYSPVMPHTLFFDEEFSGFAGEIRAFAEAVQARREAPVTGEDGIHALVLARMIHASIEERRSVSWSEVAG